MIYVRKEQAELLLKLKGDVDTANSIAQQAQHTLNTACAGVLAGIVADGSSIEAVRIEGERGVVVTQ